MDRRARCRAIRLGRFRCCLGQRRGGPAGRRRASDQVGPRPLLWRITLRKSISRRDFLKTAAVLPLAGAAIPAAHGKGRLPAEEKVRVVLVRDAELADASGKPRAEVVQRMLDDAVRALAGETDLARAWRTVIRPEDTVGIKTNVWAKLPTPAEVEQALRRRVLDAGVPEDRLAVDDRGVLANPVFQRATALLNARPARTHQWSGMGSCIKNYIQFV